MYANLFANRADICSEFGIEKFDGFVVYADYEYENYSGDAAVIYVNDGKLFMVSSSHCSCNGLEDTWAPDEVTFDMLKVMAENGWGKDKAAAEYVISQLDKFHTPDVDALVASVSLLGEDA